MRTPRRFNLVGTRWRGRADPEIELRVRRGGRWSRAKEPTPTRTTTRTLERRARGGILRSDLVGRAGAVQYRTSRRVPGCACTSWTWATGARERQRRLGRRGAPGRPGLAGRAPFPYVSRAGWGAEACPPRYAPSYGTVSAIHVHHTVSLNDYARGGPGDRAAIRRFHRNSNGWADIGYNMLVDKYGTLYEGRAGGLDQAVVGAQAQGFNSQTAVIANIGDHSYLPQTPRRCRRSPPTSAGSCPCTYSRLGIRDAHERRWLGEPLPGGREGHGRACDRPPRHGQDGLPRRGAVRAARGADDRRDGRHAPRPRPG